MRKALKGFITFNDVMEGKKTLVVYKEKEKPVFLLLHVFQLISHDPMFVNLYTDFLKPDDIIISGRKNYITKQALYRTLSKSENERTKIYLSYIKNYLGD